MKGQAKVIGSPNQYPPAGSRGQAWELADGKIAFVPDNTSHYPPDEPIASFDFYSLEPEEIQWLTLRKTHAERLANQLNYQGSKLAVWISDADDEYQFEDGEIIDFKDGSYLQYKAEQEEWEWGINDA